MMKYITLLFVCTYTLSTWAASTNDSGVRYKAYTDIFDTESLRRGAEAFAQRCLACHSAKFMRFKRVADDLGWTEEEIQHKMIRYSRERGADWFAYIESAIDPTLTEEVFHIAPPDLSLIARVKGTDYLVSYFFNYYQDANRPFNTNNTLLPNTAMPNVLAFSQGVQTADMEDGHITGYTLAEQGTMNKKEFYNYVTDLVNFLDYMGEPAKAKRMSIGWWVILFTLVLAAFAYFLKKNYWLDVPKKQ